MQPKSTDIMIWSITIFIKILEERVGAVYWIDFVK